MIKFSLFLLRLIHKPIEWMGADYHQLRMILKTKLTIDFRRGPASMNSSSKKKQAFKLQLIFLAIMGLMIAIGFISIKDLLLNYTIAYSVLMVMLATNLIGEFTSVLFDPLENQIILVRPVNNRTLLLSRLLHILFYIMYIGLALSLISVIVTVFKYNLLTAVFYFIGTILCAWIAILLTVIFYFFISKIVTGEKFKDIISYVQISLSILVIGGYQLFPRLMELNGIGDYTMTIKNYTFFYPPAWLAAWVQLSNPNKITLDIIILAATGLLFSLVGGIFLVRFLAEGFTNILAVSSESSNVEIKKKSVKNNGITLSRIPRILCISETEKTGWKFATIVTRRDRKFKQAVYPSYGLMFILALLMLKPDFNNLSSWYNQLGESSRYLMVIFFSFFTTISIDQLKYTDTVESGWIYKALPVQKPGHILSGAVKAMLIKHFLPVYIILTVTVTIVWGTEIIPLMIMGAALVVLSTLITLLLQNKALPFTQPREMQQKTGNFVKMIIGLMVMGAIVGITYLVSTLPAWLIIVCTLVTLYCNSFAYKQIRKTTFQF